MSKKHWRKKYCSYNVIIMVIVIEIPSFSSPPGHATFPTHDMVDIFMYRTFPIWSSFTLFVAKKTPEDRDFVIELHRELLSRFVSYFPLLEIVSQAGKRSPGGIRDACKKNNGKMWEFFPNWGPPPPPCLGIFSRFYRLFLGGLPS